MRVAQLAELTGTTVRTVRHYHQIGLLPVPPTRGGVRDYDLGHVARMIRIRWLVEAGVPLSDVPDMLADLQADPQADPLADARATVLEDLGACVRAIDDRLSALTAQRERLTRLLAAVADGDPLTPLPATVAGYYDRIEALAPDERTRLAIRRERDFIELAWYRGDVPPEAELLFQAISDDQALQSVVQFGRDLDIDAGADPGCDPDAGGAPGAHDARLQARADEIVARMLARFGPDPAPVARSVDPDRVRRAYDLFARVGTAQEARLGRLVLAGLLDAIEGNRP